MRHDVRSITKSITSLLVGIAIDRGWIDDIDAPVFSFFPEHDDLETSENEIITLRHLLTMSAGLAWNENLPYSDPANSGRQMINAPDQVCRVCARQWRGGTTSLNLGVVRQMPDVSAQICRDSGDGRSVISPRTGVSLVRGRTPERV